MKLEKLAGATSEIWQIFVQDKTSTVGAGLAGLVFNTASLTAYYHRDTDTAATVIALVTMTVGTFTSSGFKEIDATNMPGWYQFCPPNAALAAGAKSCGFHLKGGGNMADLPIEVQLVAYNPDSATNLGLSAIPTANPGAANGILISGSNSGTTTLGALTVTGTATISDGIVVTRSSSNTDGISVTGNGTGNGIKAISGSGATGDGFRATANSTNGHGFVGVAKGSGSAMLLLGDGAGSGSGFSITAGGTGNGISVNGGGTSGDGINVATTSGHGINLAPAGASKHGFFSTGGSGGTSDGVKAVAGTGGVDIRGNITGNLVGTVSTLTTYTGNTPQTGDAYARLGAPAGATTAADIAAVKTDTAAVKVQTDKFVFTVPNQVDSNVITKTGFSLSATGFDLVVMSDLAGPPAATATVKAGLSWLFMSVQNDRKTTSTQDKISNNAGVAVGTATVSDDGTTYEKTAYL